MNCFILFIGVLLFSLNVNGQSNEVKYGGQIGYDRWICSGEEVGPILNIMNPVGGNGDVEFEWISSNTKDIWDSGVIIINASAKELNPTTLSETTYFLRKSKRTAQDKFTGNSNVVTVFVSKNTESCKMQTLSEG
jgi:hypothetical protein